MESLDRLIADLEAPAARQHDDAATQGGFFHHNFVPVLCQFGSEISPKSLRAQFAGITKIIVNYRTFLGLRRNLQGAKK